jgi:Ni/Co efflux regulator RcnB
MRASTLCERQRSERRDLDRDPPNQHHRRTPTSGGRRQRRKNLPAQEISDSIRGRRWRRGGRPPFSRLRHRSCSGGPPFGRSSTAQPAGQHQLHLRCEEVPKPPWPETCTPRTSPFTPRPRHVNAPVGEDVETVPSLASPMAQRDRPPDRHDEGRWRSVGEALVPRAEAWSSPERHARRAVRHISPSQPATPS